MGGMAGFAPPPGSATDPRGKFAIVEQLQLSVLKRRKSISVYKQEALHFPVYKFFWRTEGETYF